MSAGVVIVFVAAILFGSARDDGPPPPTWVVVAASEDWRAGEPPGAFSVVSVLGPAGASLASVGDLSDQVPVVRVPAGSLVSKAMLGPPDASVGNPDAALFKMGVSTAHWGSGMPTAGDRAVVAASFGACAIAILELVDAQGPVVWVEANPELAARLASVPGPFVWEAPENGWPACQVEDTPLVDYAQITNQAVCEDAGGQWTSGGTPPCEAQGSTTPVKPAPNTFINKADCDTHGHTWTGTSDLNGDGDMEDDNEGTCA